MDALNPEQAARLLGISKQRMGDLVRAGVLPKAGRGAYDPFALVPAYTEHLREAAAGRAGDGDSLAHARAELARAQTRKLEREEAKERRELLPAAEVKAEWSKHIVAAKGVIMGIPSAVQTRATLPLAAAAVVEAECRRALETLAGGEL